MKTIEEKKRDRFRLLEAVYNETEGSSDVLIDNMYELARALGFDIEYYSLILNYLMEESLLFGYGIKHQGILEYEEAVSNPTKPTEHFLPLNLTINSFSNNHQSNFQFGNQNTSTIMVSSQEEKHAYETLVPLLHSFLQELDNEREEKAELEAELKSLEAQLNSPKPKYLKEFGKSIRSIVEGLAVAGLSNLKSIETILKMLPG